MIERDLRERKRLNRFRKRARRCLDFLELKKEDRRKLRKLELSTFKYFRVLLEVTLAGVPTELTRVIQPNHTACIPALERMIIEGELVGDDKESLRNFFRRSLHFVVDEIHSTRMVYFARRRSLRFARRAR
jgi:hypothetical protein